MLGDAWNGAPPLIYIVGSHPLLGRELCTGLLEPTSPSNEELPRRRLEAVGPMGRSAAAGPAGLSVGPPTFSFAPWATLGAHLSLVCGSALFLLNFCSGGLLIHVWCGLINRCLLLSQKGCDCPPFSAKSCTHRNLEGHVEFGYLLVAWV